MYCQKEKSSSPVPVDRPRGREEPNENRRLRRSISDHPPSGPPQLIVQAPHHPALSLARQSSIENPQTLLYLPPLSPKMSAFALHDDPDALDDSYTEPDPETLESPSSSAQERDRTSPAAGNSHSRSNNPLLGDDTALVSDLEQEVLDEYTRLLRNVNQVSFDLSLPPFSSPLLSSQNLAIQPACTYTNPPFSLCRGPGGGGFSFLFFSFF